jgi:O-succinylbenzoic acid--CoA ligase
MTSLPFSGPYTIDGRNYSREELRTFCHMKIHNGKNPDWYRKVFQFIQLFLDPDSGTMLQRSSGTTGDPKEFELQRQAMEASAIKTLWFFKLKPGDRVLLCLPVDYIAGKMMVVRALVGGLDLVLTEPSSRPLKSAEGSFSFVPMVPLQVVESLKAGDNLSRCGTLLIGGGELPVSLKTRVLELSNLKVYESFGMSETYTHFALRRINGSERESSFHLLEGALISRDSRACLVVDLPGVTPGPVISNDLVEIGPGGDRFTWLGRYDNVINTGGIKVIPEILEERIGKLLGTSVLLLPVEDEQLGQKMVLLVEGTLAEDPSALKKTEDLLKSKLATVLSSHELPRQLILVSQIPRNASFKPDRKAAVALLS